MEIISFTINLEHIGDIIDKNLCQLALKKIKRGYQFSPEGAAELTAFHKRVCECLQAAFGIFMAGDVAAARRLVREKAELRKAAEPTCPCRSDPKDRQLTRPERPARLVARARR